MESPRSGPKIKRMILVSGMAATGKTTFANWLSLELSIPLVSYDNIAKKTVEIVGAICDDLTARSLSGIIPYHFFWFNSEEILKSSSPLIMEYFFNDLCRPILDGFVQKYGYDTVNIHFDSAVPTAHARYCERNKNTSDAQIRPLHDLETFERLSVQNRNFRYGENIIRVDTNDFSVIDYESILRRIISL